MKQAAIRSTICFLTIFGVIGCATAPSSKNVKYYDDLSGVTGVIPTPGVAAVTITTNVDALPATCASMPIDGIKVYRDDHKYRWEANDLRIENYSALKDTIALVCTHTYTEDDLLVTPYISGATLVPRVSNQVRMGRLYPIAYAISGFENVKKPKNGFGIYAVSSRDGSFEGFIGAFGTGQVTYVWFVPNMESNYEVIFPKKFPDGKDKSVRKMNIHIGG